MGFHGTHSTKVERQNVFVLDSVYDAGPSFSLRRLRSSYTGKCIKVRRSSDNAEKDIGFFKNQLDVADLLTFCSGASGFVTTWYDQSRNGYNAIQTTNGNQPRIVNSGVLDSLNGYPAIQFDSHLLNFTYTGGASLTTLQSYCVIAPALASLADNIRSVLWSYASGGSNNANRGIAWYGGGTGSLAGETLVANFSSAGVNGGRLGSNSYSWTANEIQLMITSNRTVGTGFWYDRDVDINGTAPLNLAAVITTATNTSPSNCNTTSEQFYIKSFAGNATNAVSQKIFEMIFTTTVNQLQQFRYDLSTYYNVRQYG